MDIIKQLGNMSKANKAIERDFEWWYNNLPDLTQINNNLFGIMKKQIFKTNKSFNGLKMLLLLVITSQSVYAQTTFTAKQTKGCTPLVVEFQENHNQVVTNRFWDFGNGNTSTLQNPSAMYTQPGTYSISLISTYQNGTKDTTILQQYIEVFKNPTALFETNKSIVCANEKVNIESKSTKGTGHIVSYTWDFGDGKMYQTMTPSHSYEQGGDYSVTLLIEDNNGCKSNYRQQHFYQVYNLPHVDFIADKTLDCGDPLEIKFQSTIGNQQIVQYNWNFGDGKTSHQANPSHTYTTKGNFNVSLEIEDNNTCKHKVTKTSFIQNVALKANFSTSNQKSCEREIIQFTNNSTPKRNDVKYSWDFADGTNSGQENPSKVYIQSGTYKVKLYSFIPQTNCLDSFTVSNAIQIVKAQHIIPVISDSIFCELPKRVFFEPSKAVQQAFWKFTNSPYDTSSKHKTSFLFQQPGTYNIAYDFKDMNGCKVSGVVRGGVKIAAQKVNIKGKLAGCIPFTENFSAHMQDNNKIKSYAWYINDSLVSTNPTYTHHFNTPGEGEIRLIVETEQGCGASLTAKYSYGEKTNPDFEPTESIICFEEIPSFKILPDTTKPAITQSEWIFEGKKKKQNFHQFSKFENQEVTLITYNYGCADTVVKQFDIDGADPIIQGPSVEIITHYDTCGRTLSFVNNTKSYTSFYWNINGVIDTFSKSLKFDLADTTQLYNVKIVATNNQNRCPDDSATVQINTIPKLISSYVHDQNLCAPASVVFTNQSNFNDKDIFKWYINGSQVQKSTNNDEEVVSSSVDIDYSVGQNGTFNPTFKFGNSGDFKISVIGNRFGCIDTFTQNVTIVGPKVNVEVVKLNNCMPIKLVLKDNLFASKKVAMWVIGENDTIRNPQVFTNYTLHNAPANGILKVKYIEWDANGCLTWKRLTVDINGPSISFNDAPIYTCDKTSISLQPIIKNMSTSENVSYMWNLGDGSVSQASKVEHRYNENGVYDVSLRVTTDSGCFSTFTKQVTFNEELLNAAIMSDTTGSFCPPLLVGFTNLSTARSQFPITNYLWQFGDGTISTQENPKKSFISPGQFSVKLTIKDALGCIDTVRIPDMITVKGPNGSYDFDKEQGCEPLLVNMSIQTNSSTNSILWDLGDGSLSPKGNHPHYYTRPGTYYPMVILTDTFGCQFVLPQTKKIEVFAKPQAVFTLNGKCFGDSTIFKNDSRIASGNILTQKWSANGQAFSTTLNPQFVFEQRGEKAINLWVESDKGCVDSTTESVIIRAFDPAIVTDQKQLCLGETIHIKNNSKADGNIVKYEWELSNGNTYIGKDLAAFPDKKGWYSANLTMTDDIGCDTTIQIQKFVLVGDTLPNISPEILSVSVYNDFSIELKHNASKEVDFQSYLLYRQLPSGINQLVKESSDVNDTLFFEAGLHTLQNVYCYTLVENNICNYKESPDDKFFHCTIDVKGTPDTNLCIVDWNAYHGWDEVETYEIYRKVEGETSFTKLATLPGNTLNYEDTSIVCRNMHYYRILAYDKNSDEVSWSDTCLVVPIYFNIVPSPIFTLSSVYENKEIEMYWDEPKNSRNPIISYEINKSINNGQSYKHLVSLDNNRENFYLDNKKLDVQSSNYYYQIKAIDMCGDESVFSEFTRPILLKAKLNRDYKPSLTWSSYQKWDEGVAYYEIEQLMPHGEFVKIGQTKSGKDTSFIHHDVEMNCMEMFAYRVTAVKDVSNFELKDGATLSQYPNTLYSYSNHAEVEVESKLFAGNAFSPNGDGLNDVYEAKGIYLKSFHLKIFNRWGEQLFESNECMATWDGYYEGSIVPDGVYLVMISAIGADGKLHVFNSDLTVLR